MCIPPIYMYSLRTIFSSSYHHSPGPASGLTSGLAPALSCHNFRNTYLIRLGGSYICTIMSGIQTIYTVNIITKDSVYLSKSITCRYIFYCTLCIMCNYKNHLSTVTVPFHPTRKENQHFVSRFYI